MDISLEQQCVLEWLTDELNLPVFADAYEVAIHLLKARTPGYIALVAHVGRDFINILARNVAGGKSATVQYKNLVNDVAKEWRDEWRGPEMPPIENTKGGHLVASEACGKVQKLLAEHKDGSDRSKSAVYQFFETFLGEEDISENPAKLVKDLEAAKEWFQAFAHLRIPAFSEKSHSEVERHFHTLHRSLYLAARSEFGRLKRVNEILEITNSRDDR